MNKVDFTYNDDKFIVQCSNEDKMKDIISRFLTKAGKERQNIVFLYNGLMINEELTFTQCANRLDRSRNYMNIVVVEGQSSVDDSVNLKKSNYIICPQCQENSILNINNFKLSITGCTKGHKTENLELKELEKTQLIDQSKIFCDNCHNSKSDTNENKFFFCNNCKQKLCPNCKDIHDNSHSDFIKDYEESQFFCKVHFSEFICYCNDCKKDLCSSCQNEHEDHDINNFDNIMKNFTKMRDKELKDTKEKIYQIKTIINGMIYQLNHLNKNLDIYFEIYDNIVSNYDIKKRNNYVIENINNMKKYNDNFLGHITEILKDDNLKTQFVNIISLQTKIDFKKVKKNQIAEPEITNNENEILEDDDNEENNNIEQNIPLDDTYENFNINSMKELQTYSFKNEVEKMLILKDGRILTLQDFYDEEGNIIYKLGVYSLKKGFSCDINMDYEYINEWFQVDDGNIIMALGSSKDSEISVVKIKTNKIEKIWTFENEVHNIKKLLNNNFLLNINLSEKTIKTGFFEGLKVHNREETIHKYEDGKLILFKSVEKFKKDKEVTNFCQIRDNEYVYYVKLKGKVYGKNDFLIFFDMQNESVIKKLKVGSGENNSDMLLINKDNLLIDGRDGIIKLIDVKNRLVKNKYTFNIYIDNEYIIILNETKFLSLKRYISQYEFEESDTMVLKEEIKIRQSLISKYPGNRLIIYYDKNITIYG